MSQTGSNKEFSLRVPKMAGVKYQIMKFSSNLNIDFAKWSHAKMERDVNQTDERTPEEDMPKFGAGSEYGREARQEAKKRKYGGIKKSSESSPWLLKAGGKKFKGVREGGITDNSSYYLFTHGDDGVINAHKLEEFYNFKPVQCYKTLTVEEAEEQFGRRNDIMNHFNVMIQKIVRNEEIEEEVDDDEKGKSKKGSKNCKSKELKISEMEEWDLNDGEESDEEDVLDEEKAKNKKKQKKTTKAKPKQKSKGSDESATEESDDGDEEGRELDYISDSSDEVSDDEAKVTKEMQGVSEEKALKSLLTSDEDEEDDEKKEECPEDKINSDFEDDKIPKKEEIIPKQLATNKKKKKVTLDSESESSVDSSDIESEPIIKRPFGLDAMKSNGDPNSFTNDSSNQSSEPAQKKARVDFSPMAISDSHGITEEAVCRYLSRKPITTTELVTKFKNRTNLSSEQLVSIIALLLKKINPEKKVIKNKMYLSLKHANTK